MFKSKKTKIVASLVLLMVGGLCMWFILNFVAIGPGLPPPRGMPMWYVPGLGTRIENETLIEVRSVAEHFELIDDRIMDETPSCFPAVSQYCGYANCKRTGSDDQYLIAAWYFDDEKKFLQSERDLYQYLENHGQVSTVELDISEEISEEIKRRENISAWRPTFGPKSFDATKYESEITSGFFLVYKTPFIEGRDDYFIVYYGAMGSVNLSNQTPLLEELVASRYYLNEPGTVGDLMS